MIAPCGGLSEIRTLIAKSVRREDAKKAQKTS